MAKIIVNVEGEKEVFTMAIEWSQSIEVGLPAIDNQHKELIKLINEVFNACNNGKGKQTVGTALKFAMSYTVTHFKSEEELMRAHNYPQFVVHKKAHDDFIKDVTALKKEFDLHGPVLTVVLQLNKLLIDWLIKHIQSEDKRLAEFERAKRSK